ncbi:S1C family serine protease [Arthrobacter sp. N199823]|uniref:S1C family serine protease n=1 Tax=Arthrobacter sp. N199823 TaxID=2058895 RepID=UPI002157B4E3|nr:trypsin-like peptidase domain-containing protein [Arthrobacter sp. N199823]
MSENNGEHTTNSNEQSEQAKQAEAAQAKQAGTAQPAQPAQAPEGFAQHGYAAPVPPTAPRYAAQTSSMDTPSAGVPAPPAARPAAYGAPAAPASNPYGAPQPPANSNPTERIPAPPAHSAGSGSAGSGSAGAHSAGSQNVGSQNPTEPIPTGFGAHNGGANNFGTSSFGNTSHDASTPGHGEGYAGPGYPASNAYPQTLAPGVAPQRKTKDGKKVGMGMFTTGVLAAALVGGLVGGGSLFLLNQQGGNSSVGATSQSAPLVVNNTNSVNQVTAAAAKAMPSVVTISATSGSSGGTGSGIILDTEGHILTNTHVVTLDGAAAHAAIQVQTSDNKVYDATIVGTDPLSDLAVIKIDAPNLVPADLGESSKINVGDTVIAIGSPLGLNATVTEGIVSTLNRTIQVASSAVPETPSDSAPDQNDGGGFQFSPPGGGSDTTAATGTVNLNVIQTDAAINPGNSGGALVNAQGQIIGVNVAIASTGSSSSSSSQSGNIGVGFSIPMDHAKRVAQDIIKTGTATHGQLGVTVGSTSSTVSNSSFSSGATVAEVTSGSAAAKAGLKKGDVITKLGNRTISDPSELTAAVREQSGGATVKVDFTRGGKAQSVDVTLDTMK